MKTVKTAISIDASVFLRVERLAKRLHISRSQFFTQAARYMVDKDENLDLLRKINAAYETDHDETIQREHEKAYTRRKAAQEW